MYLKISFIFFSNNFPSEKKTSPFFLIWLTLDQFVSLGFFPFCLGILHVLSYWIFCGCRNILALTSIFVSLSLCSDGFVPFGCDLISLFSCIELYMCIHTCGSIRPSIACERAHMCIGWHLYKPNDKLHRIQFGRNEEYTIHINTYEENQTKT